MTAMRSAARFPSRVMPAIVLLAVALLLLDAATTLAGAPIVTNVQPDTGVAKGGTSVAISGSGFVAGATEVRFGARQVKATVESASLLIASTPAGGGSVKVTVITTEGASPSSPGDGFAYRSGDVGVAWGSGARGELGDGANPALAVTPVPIIGLPGGVSSFASAAHSSLVLLEDGRVMAFGGNRYGQLGDGAKQASDVPVQVRGLSGATALAAGRNFGLALLGSGQVMAWGEGRWGQLGDGLAPRSDRPARESDRPVAVQASGRPGALGKVVAVAAGSWHALGLLASGDVVAWGRNTFGSLGDGATGELSGRAVKVRGLTGVRAVAAGDNTSVALLNDGHVRTWGYGATGQLGSSEVTGGSRCGRGVVCSPVPVAVREADGSELSGVTAVAAGANFDLALMANGTVRAWGYNGKGALGDGSTTDSDSPVEVKGLMNVTAIAAGEDYALALLANGDVEAWGDDRDGQLGSGETTGSDVPVGVVGAGGTTSIAAGGDHALATRAPMWVGLNASGWGPSKYADVTRAVDAVRVEGTARDEVARWIGADRGVHIIYERAGVNGSGGYCSGAGTEPSLCDNEGHRSGAAAIDPTRWAQEAVAYVRANPGIAAVEVLNEAYGEWFWGSGADDQANATAYARLLAATHEAFVRAFGAARPLILASDTWEVESDEVWNGEVFDTSGIDALADVDGIVAHPYGGEAGRAESAAGDRHEVEQLHALDGKPIYVTEVGWPTCQIAGCKPTGDALQWTQAEQAENVEAFVKWAFGTGYVADVDIFGYRDYGPELSGDANLDQAWGVETWEGRYGRVKYASRKKLAYMTLKALTAAGY